MTQIREVKPGVIYRHFKGDRYRALFEAIDSEAEKEGREERVVVYEGITKPGYFVRPVSMFLGDVESDGTMRHRFAEEEDSRG